MTGNAKVLVVEDDNEMRELVSRALKKEGYRVSAARDGREMERVLRDERVDLVVLDVMLPGEDGLSLCRGLRARSTIPVIIVSAKGEELDRIVGLKMGADDYLGKPFSTPELLARIESVLRRSQGVPSVAEEPSKGFYVFGDWRLDPRTRELTSTDDVVVPLSTGEYDLLIAFLERPNRVLSREQLLDLARGRDAVAFDRSIDTQVSRLRRKIETDPRNPKTIKTVWGGGYLFAADVTRG